MIEFGYFIVLGRLKTLEYDLSVGSLLSDAFTLWSVVLIQMVDLRHGID